MIVAGGQNEAHEPQAAIVAIDPVTGRVRDAGTLTTRSVRCRRSSNAGGRLILIGGKTARPTR